MAFTYSTIQRECSALRNNAILLPLTLYSRTTNYMAFLVWSLPSRVPPISFPPAWRICVCGWARVLTFLTASGPGLSTTSSIRTHSNPPTAYPPAQPIPPPKALLASRTDPAHVTIDLSVIPSPSEPPPTLTVAPASLDTYPISLLLHRPEIDDPPSVQPTTTLTP